MFVFSCWIPKCIGSFGSPPLLFFFHCSYVQNITEQLDPHREIVARAVVTGPGFINVHLNRNFIAHAVQHNLLTSNIQQFHRSQEMGLIGLEQELEQMGQQQELEQVGHGEQIEVIVDFSSPNLAKKMHIGHLRSTIIGDALCRILEFTGEYKVQRVNHLGDWGTQFGMLVAYGKRIYGDSVLEQINHDFKNIDKLQQLYRDAKKLFDGDQLFKREAHEEVIRLQEPHVQQEQQGDQVTQQLWHTVCDTSKQELQRIYKMLNIKLIDRGESFYAPYIPTVIADLEAKQLLKTSNGAKVMFVKLPEQKRAKQDAEFHLMVQKSDLGYTYDTTDLAALWYRTQEQHANWLIYVVDAGQSAHFQLVFEAGRQAGWVKPEHRVDHVSFGVVYGLDGKKFKTREGDLVELHQVLEEAKRRALEKITQRGMFNFVLECGYNTTTH